MYGTSMVPFARTSIIAWYICGTFQALYSQEADYKPLNEIEVLILKTERNWYYNSDRKVIRFWSGDKLIFFLSLFLA